MKKHLPEIVLVGIAALIACVVVIKRETVQECIEKCQQHSVEKGIE